MPPMTPKARVLGGTLRSANDNIKQLVEPVSSQSNRTWSAEPFSDAAGHPHRHREVSGTFVAGAITTLLATQVYQGQLPTMSKAPRESRGGAEVRCGVSVRSGDAGTRALGGQGCARTLPGRWRSRFLRVSRTGVPMAFSHAERILKVTHPSGSREASG